MVTISSLLLLLLLLLLLKYLPGRTGPRRTPPDPHWTRTGPAPDPFFWRRIIHCLERRRSQRWSSEGARRWEMLKLWHAHAHAQAHAKNKFFELPRAPCELCDSSSAEWFAAVGFRVRGTDETLQAALSPRRRASATVVLQRVCGPDRKGTVDGQKRNDGRRFVRDETLDARRVEPGCVVYLIPYTLYTIPYTLYSIPYALYPIPYTLYPIPYTLYPIYPIPCTTARLRRLRMLLRGKAERCSIGSWPHLLPG